MRDTQNGMRLLRGRALATFPAGGYEAETIHLRRVLRDGVPVAWVPIPAIYAEEQSSFRAGRDSASALGIGAAARTTHTDASPSSTPSRLPTSTSLA